MTRKPKAHRCPAIEALSGARCIRRAGHRDEHIGVRADAFCWLDASQVAELVDPSRTLPGQAAEPEGL